MRDLSSFVKSFSRAWVNLILLILYNLIYLVHVTPIRLIVAMRHQLYEALCLNQVIREMRREV